VTLFPLVDFIIIKKAFIARIIYMPLYINRQKKMNRKKSLKIQNGKEKLIENKTIYVAYMKDVASVDIIPVEVTVSHL
jgi:hypothetical protein